jgi:Tfp pilus assembly protein PilN
MFLRRQSARGACWTAVVQDGSSVHAAQVVYAEGARPRVTRLWQAQAPDVGQGLQALQASLNTKNCNLVGVLDRAMYRMQATEAPDIPRQDWRDALRWQLKEQVEFAVEDAVLDVLDMPQATQLRHNTPVMVFMVPREDYTRLELAADDLGLSWQALDVPETALRNVCALTEEGEKAQALVVFGDAHGMLVITFKGELLMARHIEVTVSAIKGDEEGRGAALSRAALEILRTVDTFERMHSQVQLATMTVALPPGCQSDVLDMLADLIYVPLQCLSLKQYLDLDELGDDAERLDGHATFDELCALGATLRAAPEFAERQHLQLLDPNSVLGHAPAWGALLGARLAGGFAAVGLVAGIALSATATAYERRASNLEAEVGGLRAADVAMPPSPAVKELEGLRQKEAQQRQVQDTLAGSMAWSSQGYSDYLMALSRKVQTNVWITGLSVQGDGRQLVLSGRTTDPANIPAYLQRLSEEERFKGRKFAQVELAAMGGDQNMVHGVVQFTLRSLRQGEPGKQSDEDGSTEEAMHRLRVIRAEEARARAREASAPASGGAKP